jgi:hypothetical protein
VPQENEGRSSPLPLAIGVHGSDQDQLSFEAFRDQWLKEPAFMNDFANDLNGYLKWEKLGKTEESSPRLRSLLAVCKKAMGKKQGSEPTDREKITAAVA